MDNFRAPLLALLLAAVTASAEEPFNHAHSHNDYLQPMPLVDAIQLRFSSVEADVYLSDGEIKVSHLPWDYVGTLKELYLDPLQELVDRQGSVLGDGTPFILWVDLKQSRESLRRALHHLLESYPMLTMHGPGWEIPGPVYVVLTGSESSKAAYVREYPVRRANRDSNEFRESDRGGDDSWTWYALDWARYVGGDWPLTSKERARLRATVGAAHLRGRKIRFWNMPENEDLWRAALDEGTDLIGVDDLMRLHHFLAGLQP